VHRRVRNVDKDHGDSASFRLNGCGDPSRLRENDVRLQGNQLLGERREPIDAATKPVVDAHIATLLPAMQAQALLKALAPCLLLGIVSTKRKENADAADRSGRLRTCVERPRKRCASKR
jgi:hypothetical protein